MSILERLLQKRRQEGHSRSIAIATLGDSVTQGCFEVYQNGEGKILPVYEPTNAYPHLLWMRLTALCPDAPFHVVNAGRSGDRAPGGLARVERDVLSHNPDLVVVCYGLNDCGNAADSTDTYVGALEKLLCRLQESGCEIIFMTPNTMNHYVCHTIENPAIRAVAERTCGLQVKGIFDRHIEAAVALCRKMGVRVCDCYRIWQNMQSAGVDTTALLSNRINHPTREMNALFADELIKTMLERD